MEAELMRRMLDRATFAEWLAGLLAGVVAPEPGGLVVAVGGAGRAAGERGRGARPRAFLLRRRARGRGGRAGSENLGASARDAAPRGAGAPGGGWARAVRAGDLPARGCDPYSAGRAAGALDGAGGPARDRHRVPPRRPLATGARDPQGGGVWARAEPAWRARRVGGGDGSGDGAILDQAIGNRHADPQTRPRTSDCRLLTAEC